jgi:hypothetical protein
MGKVVATLKKRINELEEQAEDTELEAIMTEAGEWKP